MRGVLAVAIVVAVLVASAPLWVSGNENAAPMPEDMHLSERAASRSAAEAAGGGMAQSTTLADSRYDLDGDGVVSILDLTLLASHLYQHAEPCIAIVERVNYSPPIDATEPASGNPIRISGRGYLDPNSPLLATAEAGGDVARCP